MSGSLVHQLPAKENVTGIIGARATGRNVNVDLAVLPF